MEAYLGEIRLIASTYAPRGWALCNGQTLQMSSSSKLFSIIGTIYGGDGVTTFKLPDLQGRVPMHWGEGNGLTPRAVGEQSGSNGVTLTLDQMPEHNHPATAQTVSNSSKPNDHIWATAAAAGHGAGTRLYSKQTNIETAKNFNAQAVEPAGGNLPHENMQPYQALNFIICIDEYATFPKKPIM